MAEGKSISIFYSVLLMVYLCGCQSTSSIKTSNETNQDVKEALGSIAEAISGKPLSDEEKQDLEAQIRKDKDAQRAVQSITESMDSTSKRLKYSPATGKRYAPHLTTDPETGVPLEWLE